MQRRKFLRTAGVGGAAIATASTLAAPAIAAIKRTRGKALGRAAR